MSALGRLLPVVTFRDFSSMTTCYLELNGRVGPNAVSRLTVVGATPYDGDLRPAPNCLD